MGQLVATRQPNGNWALISTDTKTFAGFEYTQNEIEDELDEITDELIERRLRKLEADVKALNEMRETLFSADRVQAWEKSVQWEYLRNGNKTEIWKYIKENIDPKIDEYAAAMRFNEEGEWIS